MILLLLVAPALAEPPQLSAETLFEARPDMAGDPFYSGQEALMGVGTVGPVRLEGYGQFGFPIGFDAPFGGELFLLTADGAVGPLRWTFGRQPLLLPTWSRRLDGGQLSWEATSDLSFRAAAGVGSQVGLSGTVGGAPMGRIAAAWTPGPVQATAGVWGEAGDAPAMHGDVELRWAADEARLSPEISGLAAAGQRDGATVVERGRVEVGLLPTSGVRALGWVEHREALPSDPTTAASVLDPAILATFAPGGVDTAGLATGLSTRNRARLWVSGAAQRWWTDAEATGDPLMGLTGELRWEPRCGPSRWCVRPSWQGATGDGGAYHRAGGAVGLPLPDAVALDLNAAWAPYRKPHLEWQTAWVAGALASVEAGSHVQLEAGGDVFVDGVIGATTPTTRAWLALELRAGGRP